MDQKFSNRFWTFSLSPILFYIFMGHVRVLRLSCLLPRELHGLELPALLQLALYFDSCGIQVGVWIAADNPLQQFLRVRNDL